MNHDHFHYHYPTIHFSPLNQERNRTTTTVENDRRIPSPQISSQVLIDFQAWKVVLAHCSCRISYNFGFWYTLVTGLGYCDWEIELDWP